MKKEDQTSFEKKVLKQFMSGKSLFGKDGAFAPMLKNVLEKALSAEMNGHLDSDETHIIKFSPLDMKREAA